MRGASGRRPGGRPVWEGARYNGVRKAHRDGEEYFNRGDEAAAGQRDTGYRDAMTACQEGTTSLVSLGESDACHTRWLRK